ncbi:MAG: M56 family metallopeptidase [Verrucomicrobiota bacterium JB023]|nr:M56 family metallopeptidase [Verrucomicrobiota bacterium JB023]
MSFLPSILIAAIGLLAVRLAGRRSPVLTSITLVTLLLFPFLGFLPKVEVAIPGAGNLVEGTSSARIWLLYPGGVIVFGGKFALDFLALHRWQRQSRPLTAAPLGKILAECQARLGYRRTVSLRQHHDLHSPVAAGLFRPAVYLPEEAVNWSDETLRCVLLHEVGHHARRDLWTSAIARAACVLHWFNPFTWLLRRQLLTQCEYACDHRVLATGLDAKAYAHTLCDLAQPADLAAPTLALTMATKSTLRGRVENLLAPAQPLSLLSILLTLLFTLGTAVALNTLTPALQKSLPSPVWTQQEIELRHSANPFPGN